MRELRLRELAIWAVVPSMVLGMSLGISLPAWAENRPGGGAISGYVRDATGEAQMGAVVQILGVANHSLTVFTDGAGYYAATGLLPGLYSLKVTAPSFLPALREKIGVRPGAILNVNVTLSTLLNVMQLGPVRTMPDNDDWKWTLRSVANRPILRVFNDPTFNNAAEKQTHDLRGTLSFVAGSAAGGYGSGSDMSTGFTLERSVFADGHLNFSGNVGYGDGIPAGVLRAGYSHRMVNGSEPTVGLTVRRFAPSDPDLHNAALQSGALSASDDLTLGEVVELKFGSELQTIQFLGHMTAFRPHATADVHLSPDTVLEYAYTTSRPDLGGKDTGDEGADCSTAELNESTPRVSVLGYTTQLESVHHQELSVSHRRGRTSMQVAVFSDHVGNPALTGAGTVTAVGGFLLPDVASGTFSYAGPNLDTNGLRVVLQRKFSDDLTATLDYALGGVLDLTQTDVPLQQAQQWIGTQRRHALAAKLSGTVSHTHTRWIASYRWVSGSAITPVDMFNSSPGQSDPYLNFYIRQPIFGRSMPNHMEAIIDVRNLLAQGYVPVLGQDGQTVYLVQSARSVRGGLAFTF